MTILEARWGQRYLPGHTENQRRPPRPRRRQRKLLRRLEKRRRP